MSRAGGVRCRYSTPRTPATPSSPNAAPPSSVDGTQRIGSVWNPDSANCNTTTARIAPSGSISTPSPSSTARTWSLRRVARTSGAMTVGPVTVTSAPNSAAVFHGSTSNTPSKTSSATSTSRLISTISCRSAGSNTPNTDGPAMTPARR